MKNTFLKLGDNFIINKISRYGKKITQNVTIIAIVNNRVVLSNGDEYHKNKINI